MYDASAGRWLNRDPIGLAGGMNLYGYCAGGPVGRIDESGLYEVRIGWHQVFDNAYHAFILVTDNDRSSPTYGWTWGFSAGPQRHGLESVTKPGQVTDYSGPYGPNAYDSRARYPDLSSWQLRLNCEPIEPLLKFLRRVRLQWSKADWHYNLTQGPNSNTFAHMIAEGISQHEGNAGVARHAKDVIDDLKRRKGYSFPRWGRL